MSVQPLAQNPEWNNSPEREVGRRRALAALVSSIMLAVIGLLVFQLLWRPRAEVALDALKVPQERRIAAQIQWEGTLADVRTTQQQYERAQRAGCGPECDNLGDLLALQERELNRRKVELEQSVAADELASETVRSAQLDDERDRALAWSMAAALIGFGYTFSFFSLSSAKSRYKERAALEKLRGLTDSSDGSAYDVATRLRDNELRLRTYHELVTGYASGTRLLTTTALIVGLAFVAVCGIAAALSSSVAGAVAGSVAAASISAMTAFVVGAILRNSEASSQEVRAFFLHPIHQERALNAERLISQLGGPHKDAALQALISSLADTRGLGLALRPSPATQVDDAYGPS